MIVRTLIIDDVRAARSVIRRLLKKHPNHRAVGEVPSIFKARPLLHASNYDLMLLLRELVFACRTFWRAVLARVVEQGSRLVAKLRNSSRRRGVIRMRTPCRSMPRDFPLRPVLPAFALLAGGAPLFAQSLYWDGPQSSWTWKIDSSSWSTTPGGAGSVGWTQGGDAYFTNYSLVDASLGTDITVGGMTGALNLAMRGHTFTLGANNTSTSVAYGSGNFLYTYGSGTVTKTGTGTLTLDTLLDHTTATRIEGGVIVTTLDRSLGATTAALHLDGGALRWGASFDIASTRPVFLEAGGGVFDTNGFHSTRAAAIGGSGALTKTGAGTLTFSAVQTYTGATQVEGGSLAFGIDNALAPASEVTVGPSGALHLNNHFVTLGSLSGSGLVDIGSGWLNVGANPVWTTFSGNLTGTGTFTKTGTSTLTLAGPTSFSGTTSVVGGALVLDHPLALQNSTLVTSAGVSFGSLTSVTLGGLSGSLELRNVSGVGQPLALTLNVADALHYSDTLSGTGSLIKEGAGTLTLKSANTFYGTTTVNDGLLVLANPLALQNSTLNAPENRLSFDRLTDVTLGGLASPLALQNASGQAVSLTLQIHGSASQNDAFYDGGLSGPGELIKAGSGTLHLRGANTFSGPTTINEGGLVIEDPLALQNSVVNVSNRIQFWVDNASLGGLSGLDPLRLDRHVGFQLTVGANNASSTYGGVLYGRGSLIKAGTGTLTLSGANTYTEGTTINGGTLALAGPNALVPAGDVTVASGATLDLRDFDANIGRLMGDGEIKLGAATLTITTTGVSEFSGNITGTGNLRVENQYTLLGGPTTFSGTTSVADSSNYGLSLTHPLALQNSTLVAPRLHSDLFSSLTAVTLGGLTGSNELPLQNSSSEAVALTVGGNDSSTRYSGVLSGPGSLTKIGAGTLVLSGASTYSGGTTISAGCLALEHASAAGTGAVSVAAGATLDIGGQVFDIGRLSGAGTATGFGGVFSSDSASRQDLFTTLSDRVSLQKSGQGSLFLHGAHTYSRITEIDAGTLHIDNTTGSALGTSLVIVSSGATLSGSGSFTGELRLAGTLSPGDGPGLMTIGSGSALAGTTLVELGGTSRGFTYDAINVAGPGHLTLGGALDVVLYDGWTPSGPASFHIFQATSFGGSFAQVNLPTIDGYTWDTSQLETLGTLGLSAIPEPSACAALAGFASLAGLALRRPRRAGTTSEPRLCPR